MSTPRISSPPRPGTTGRRGVAPRGARAGGTRLRHLLPVAIALLLVLAGLLLWQALDYRRPFPLRIATGSRGGSALPLGESLARVLQANVRGAHARAVESPGGAKNVALVEERSVELALVPNDADGGPDVRTLASLYDEVLHIVVRDGSGVADLTQLAGKRVAVGPEGSGTEHMTRALFAHFGVERGAMQLLHLKHAVAAEAFTRGELDVVFSLVGIGAPAVRRMLAAPGARLLSLGDAKDPGSTLAGVRVGMPFVSPLLVPAHAYGAQPQSAVGAIGVHLLLVAHAALPEDVTYDITRALHEQKVALVESSSAMVQLTEKFERGELRFPEHAGATRWYRRNEPYLIQTWAEPLSLALTLTLLAWSSFAAWRARVAQRRKDRVDVYYEDLERIADAVAAAQDEVALSALRLDLHAVRRKAFTDLMNERLEPNESFTIFQDFLRSEMTAIDSALRELRKTRERRRDDRRAEERRAGQQSVDQPRPEGAAERPEAPHAGGTSGDGTAAAGTAVDSSVPGASDGSSAGQRRGS